MLRWRYRDQLDWRLVVIVLREGPIEPQANGYNPARQARGARMFRERYGMPVGAAARARLMATDRVCRALVATRLAHPGREIAAMRALQLAWFNTTDLLDEAKQEFAAMIGAPVAQVGVGPNATTLSLSFSRLIASTIKKGLANVDKGTC